MTDEEDLKKYWAEVHELVTAMDMELFRGKKLNVVLDAYVNWGLKMLYGIRSIDGDSVANQVRRQWMRELELWEPAKFDE